MRSRLLKVSRESAHHFHLDQSPSFHHTLHERLVISIFTFPHLFTLQFTATTIYCYHIPPSKKKKTLFTKDPMSFVKPNGNFSSNYYNLMIK